MSPRPSLSIAIAAYNEEKNLEASVQTVLRALQAATDSYEVIIVDDCSRDATGAIADRLAAQNPAIKAVHNERNGGMGYSLWRGMRLATKDYVGSFPGDNALDENALKAMAELIGQADVIGYTIANPEFRSRRRQMISDTFTRILNTLFGLKVGYYNGHAIYRTVLLKELTIISTRHSFLAEVLLRLVLSGHTLKQIPTVQYDRTHGQTQAFRLATIGSVLSVVLRLWWELRLKPALGGRRT